MMMTNVDTFDEEQHIFRDVGRVIRDSFQVVSDEDEIETRSRRRLAMFDQTQQFFVNGVLEIVDLVVAQQYASCEFLIAANEGIEALSDHGFYRLRHMRSVDKGLNLRVGQK